MAQTVMLVEDNGFTRDGLTAILRKNGYDVVAVGNGLEALDRLDAGPAPDVILLDMLLPVLDGWHFLERLKKRTPKDAPPIIVTTGTILTREWAESHGCAGFLKKPIEEKQLLAELQHVLPASG
jgi:two-component system chemotaxis response regulator CheY